MQCSSFVVLEYDITHSDRLAVTVSNAGRIATAPLLPEHFR